MLWRKKTQPQENINLIKNYSPLSRVDRLIFGVLILIGLFTFIRYVLWWFQPKHIPVNWLTQQYSTLSFLDFILFAVLSLVVFFGLILKIGTWFTTWFMKRPVHIPAQPGLKVAFLTCYVPGNEPIEMLRATLVAMRDTKYPHDTWVLDEGSQDEVKQLTQELGVKYFSRFQKPHYNQSIGPFRRKTKAGNLNSWRNEHEHEYDIVAQVDMDHVPHNDYLTKLLGFFSDPTVGFVGVPQIYKNTENWIAKGAAEQTHFYYGPLQQGFYGAHMPFLIGTTHVYRVKAMKSFGGYSPTIAEDYLTGMHFFSHGWKGVYVPEVLAEGLGPTTWSDYFNQQMRWSYGQFEILFKHTHKHIFRLSFKQKINLAFSQLFYFSGLTTFLGFILTSSYLVFGVNSTNMSLAEWSQYAIPSYLSGALILLFLHKFYVDPKKESKVALFGMILGQAASLIYTVAFIKFITRQKLTYVVTSKDANSNEVINWKVFGIHIVILLVSILTLEISFIAEHDSIVMRFWAILNAFFLSLILLTAYWIVIKSFFKGIYDHYKIFEFESSKPAVLPSSPTESEKYRFIAGSPGIFTVFSIISFVTISICMYQFIASNPLMWPLFAYFALTLVYFLVSLVVNLFYKGFDLEEHNQIVRKWAPHLNPSVDIFLPTAGEPIEILNNTWLGVDELVKNYPGIINVYCLDDSGREEVQRLASDYKFRYSVRSNRGWFKKAGNLRHGFGISAGEFIVVFDADFRPRKDFLNELLPYFYENPKVGLVQSPQYFDVHEKQNWLERGAGAVQELFYRFNQVSRQRFNASICVGSNAIYRRSALQQAGGTALIEHSEDVHTGFNIRMKGWTLQYIPIILAKGICPSDMKAFFKQQYRWCLGSMSLLSSAKFWKMKMPILTRLSYFSGFFYYIHTGISSFFAPIIPIAILTLYPEQVSILNYLLLLPSIIFIQIIYPIWHKHTYGIEAWATRSVYGWAHMFAIFDAITRKTMSWQPTGAKMASDYRYISFRTLQIIFNFIPAVIWVSLALRFVLDGQNIFIPLLLGGIYYLMTCAKITFYSSDNISLSLPAFNSSTRIRTIPALAGLAVALLIATTSFTAYQNKWFIKEEFETAKAMQENIYLIDNSPVVLSEATSSSTLNQTEVYQEEVKSGDSLYRIYRRIISKYETETRLTLSTKTKRDLENYLVISKSQARLKRGDNIWITRQELEQSINNLP